jgi:hypothetical protein
MSVQGKDVPLHIMEVLVGRAHIAPTHCWGEYAPSLHGRASPPEKGPRYLMDRRLSGLQPGIEPR